MKHKYQFNSLHELTNSPEWDGYEHDNLGLQGRILSGAQNPEVVTHGDYIEAQRDFIGNTLHGDIPAKKEAHLYAELNRVEKWHAAHGTLDDVLYDYGGE